MATPVGHNLLNLNDAIKFHYLGNLFLVQEFFAIHSFIHVSLTRNPS